MKTSLSIVTVLLICLPAVGADDAENFAARWEFVGVAVSEPGYHVWGSSPILGPEGKVHLFVARWPRQYHVDPGWRCHSEIAHYVADGPEGPFRFCEVALAGTGQNTWDKYAAHNPAIHKVADRYVLLYVANDDPRRPAHPANQRIGMALSTSLHGPWRKAGTDGMILAPPADPKYWNYQAGNGVNNPAFLQHPDGGFFLYFKSQGGKMGLAVAQDLEGPYVQLPFPVTRNDRAVEDGYAFIMDGKFRLLTTDNHGLLKTGGGILWTSEDGIHFDRAEPGFDLIETYVGKEKLKNAVRYYGGKIKFERPQVLLVDGKPKYLYAPSGYHIFGGPSTVSYVLHFRE